MKISIHEADLPGDSRSPDELLAIGWVYRDIGWTAETDWNLLFDIIKPENFNLCWQCPNAIPPVADRC